MTDAAVAAVSAAVVRHVLFDARPQSSPSPVHFFVSSIDPRKFDIYYLENKKKESSHYLQYIFTNSAVKKKILQFQCTLSFFFSQTILINTALKHYRIIDFVIHKIYIQ